MQMRSDFRNVSSADDGAAIANTGHSLRLTYLYRGSNVILDANLIYDVREAKETNPIYDELMETDRRAAALTAFFPAKKYTNSVLSVFVTGEVYRENANIDFYDMSVGMVTAGVIWRHEKN